MQKGIDVSEFQGIIDYTKVKESGISFAIVRAGFGNSISQTDKEFVRNMENALKSGVDVGAYWFSYATSVSDAVREADVFNELMTPYRGRAKYPLYYDYEYDSYSYSVKKGITPTGRLITDMAKAFMDRLEDLGWYAGWYTNLDYYYNRYYSHELRDYTLWLAHYSETPAIDCDLHQISSSGRINGIDGFVDLDNVYIDFPSAIVKSGRNGFSADGGIELALIGNAVRLRTEASTQSEIIDLLYSGEKVQYIFDQGNGWSRVRYKGREGFCVNEYLSGAALSEYKDGLCEGTEVNVRSGPSLSDSVLYRINPGKKFKIITKRNDGWLHVKIDNIEAYIYYDSSYITI